MCANNDTAELDVSIHEDRAVGKLSTKSYKEAVTIGLLKESVLFCVGQIAVYNIDIKGTRHIDLYVRNEKEDVL